MAALRGHSFDGEAPFRRRLLSRDLCWCLDVFGDELDARERLRLARDAVALDGDFSGAAARLARLAARSGDLDEARSAAERASSLAKPVQRFADARFDAVATELAVCCFALLAAALRPAPRWLPGAIRARRERARREQCERELACEAECLGGEKEDMKVKGRCPQRCAAARGIHLPDSPRARVTVRSGSGASRITGPRRCMTR